MTAKLQVAQMRTSRAENESLYNFLPDQEDISGVDRNRHNGGDLYSELSLQYVRMHRKILKCVDRCCFCRTTEICPFEDVQTRERSRRGENVS